MFNTRLVKEYKFKSASIKIYVKESVQNVEIARLGKFRMTEEKIAPFEYYMKICFRNYHCINSCQSLKGLKNSYMILHSKKQLRNPKAKND